MSRGDELIGALLAGDAEGDWEDAAHDLLREVFAGYPLGRLAPLARGDAPAAARSAAWILSELGPRAEPLIAEVVPLLGHPERYARYFAVDAVLAAATEQHGEVVARAIRLAEEDPDVAVRRKALVLLARMPAGRLTAALPYLPPALRELTSRLIGERDPDAIRSALAGPDPMRRRFAAASAVRTAAADEGPLLAALSSPDDEVATFASREQEVRQASRRG